MAGKVTFKLEALQQQAREAIDNTINAKKAEIAELSDTSRLSRAVEEWRERQQILVVQLYDNLTQTSNEELAAWRPEPMPKEDSGPLHRATRELFLLETNRGNIIAKSRSLAPDADGNVHLTKAQMFEFFGL